MKIEENSLVVKLEASGWKLGDKNHGKRSRSTAAHPQREKHAADHQGHEDGLGGQAAPRAGACPRGAALRPHDHQRARVAEPPHRNLTTPKTGNLRHPLFVTRPEKRVLLVVVSGDKGFAGAFNANILKTAYQFINGNPDKEIDIEAVGRKGRDLMRRRYPAAVYTEQTDEHGATRQVRERARARSKSPAIIPACLIKLEASRVFELAHSIISRYVHEEIDAAYIVYNEFKSVIAQRLVVERCCRSSISANPQITGAVEPTAEEKERRAPRPPSPPASSLSRPTPRRPTKKPRNSAPPRSTTSTSSRPRSSSTACCRSTFRPCSSTP